MEKQTPLLNIHHPFLQLLLFVAIAAFAYIFILFLGMLLVIPIFHISAGNLPNILDLDKLKDNSTFLSALKFVQAFSSLIFLVPALFFAFLMGEKNDYLRFSRTTYLIPVILVIGITILSQPLVNYLGDLNSRLQLPSFLNGLQQSMKSMQDKADAIQSLFLQMPNIKELLINLLVIAILPAICEEAFFRGTLQQILIKWFRNKHIAIWVTAAIFSAVHGEFFGFLPRMILGAILGYIFLWSDNLWYSIIGHMINNGLAVIAYYLYQSKIVDFNPNSNDTGPVWLLLVSILLFSGVLFIYHNYFKHHPPEDDDIVVEETTE